MDENPGRAGRGPRPSGLAAIAVVIVAVLGWWVFSGNGPQGPSGNDARYAVPEVEATGDATDTVPSPPEPAPGTLRIDSYVPRDELRIELNYRADPQCAAALETPRVIESDVSVTITLSVETEPGTGAASDSGTPCSDPIEGRTLPILLDSPLDGRAVLDGSVSPQVRVEPTTTAYQ